MRPQLSHAEEAWNACGWGEPMRSRTYKREVENMNEKVEKLATTHHNYM